MPSAMQNDVNMEQAKQIVEHGAKYYIEVANMPTTNDALAYLMQKQDLIVAPSKAVNAGGVGGLCSGNEPEQRASGLDR